MTVIDSIQSSLGDTNNLKVTPLFERLPKEEFGHIGDLLP